MSANWRLAFLGVTLVACTSAPTDTQNHVAIGKSRQTFTSVEGGGVTASYVPRSIDNSLVTVVAMLDGTPVALHQEAMGRRLSRAEKDAIKSQRKAEQAAVH